MITKLVFVTFLLIEMEPILYTPITVGHLTLKMIDTTFLRGLLIHSALKVILEIYAER